MNISHGLNQLPSHIYRKIITSYIEIDNFVITRMNKYPIFY